MRQVIIALNLLGSFIIFALSVNLLETSFMFLLFGILPNKTEPLSANQMLTIYAAAGIVVVGYALRGSASGIITALRTYRLKQSRIS